MVTPTPKRIWAAQTAKHPWCRSSAPRTKRKDASMSFFVELLRGDLLIHYFCMILFILSYLMYSQSQNENEAMNSVSEIRVYQSYVPISKLANVFYTNPPWRRKTWVTPTCPSDLPSCWSCPVSFEVSWLIQSTRFGGETKKHPLGMFPKPRMVWLMWVQTWKNPSCKFTQKHETFAHNVPCLLSEQVVMSLARTHLHPKLVWRCDVGRHLSSWRLSGTNWHVERDCSLDIIWRKLVIGVVLSYE